jgi:hypothetical protein
MFKGETQPVSKARQYQPHNLIDFPFQVGIYFQETFRPASQISRLKFADAGIGSR